MIDGPQKHPELLSFKKRIERVIDVSVKGSDHPLLGIRK